MTAAKLITNKFR